MTDVLEATEAKLRRELAQSKVARALMEAGVPVTLADYVASTGKYSAVAGGTLIEFGTLRAVDTPESVAALAANLLNPRAQVGDAGGATDPGAEAAARAAGKAAADATKAADAARRDVAFR